MKAPKPSSYFQFLLRQTYKRVRWYSATLHRLLQRVILIYLIKELVGAKRPPLRPVLPLPMCRIIHKYDAYTCQHEYLINRHKVI